MPARRRSLSSLRAAGPRSDVPAGNFRSAPAEILLGVVEAATFQSADSLLRRYTLSPSTLSPSTLPPWELNSELNVTRAAFSGEKMFLK